MNLCIVKNAMEIYLHPLYFEFSEIPSFLIKIAIGFIIGVLINYLADVLPTSRRLSQPVCPECEHPYSLKEYLLARQCPHCSQKRTSRYSIVLISSIVLSVLLNFFPFHGLNYWATIPLLIYLGLIVVIDFEHRLVLIETSVVGFILFLIYGIYFHGLLGALRGALGGMLIMLAFYFLGVVFGKVVGKLRHKAINQVPFGFGDVVFGTILGLLSGWPAIAVGLILGLLLFSAYSFLWMISLIFTKRYQSFNNAQALTPFLILGTIILFYL
ncbi:MAG: A24 family peptidase [Anaerolineaceae bacterium]